MKKDMLSVEKMLEIESWIEKNAIDVSNDSLRDQSLLKNLGLKLEYVSQEEFSPDTEAELTPIEEKSYFGLIRINKKYIDTGFAYMHEVMHYLMDVGRGKRVCSVFSRKTKGNTLDEHEQVINYATAAAILKYKDIKDCIIEYDRSSPKMDELAFVSRICKKYNQEQRTVIRRIREVRQLMKKRMSTY